MSLWAAFTSPRAAVRRRRFWRLSVRPRVTIFSTSGRISLARAWVVVMRPRSTSERAKDFRSALRCPLVRPNFLFTFPWRIRLFFEHDAETAQGALYLLDGLGAETLYLKEILFFLAGQTAYGADIGLLQRRDGAGGKVEIFDAGLQRFGRALGASCA